MPIAVAALAVSAYSAANSADGQRKALHAQQDATKAAADAAANSHTDINALNDKTKSIAIQNAIDSRNLEQALTPEVSSLRTGSTAGLINSLGLAGDNAQMQSYSPLLRAAILKAKADMDLGGRLSVDQQNLVTRHALANAGSVAGVGGGLGLGRDLTARDLGLSSMQVEQQRLATAGQLSQVGQGDFQRYLAAAQFAHGIPMPEVGLSPSAIANVSVGNQNALGAASANQANIYGQAGQNAAAASAAQQANAIKLAGLGLQAYQAYNASRPAAATTATTATTPSVYSSSSVPSGYY